jgi:transcriptional regulator with XRE-family HTH domain
MLGIKLCELADLVGLSQTAIAKHFDINRAQVNRWARGVRAVPQRYLLRLIDFVMDAARHRLQELDTKPFGLAEVAETADPTWSLQGSSRVQRRQQILTLIHECRAAEAELTNEGPTAVIPRVVEELDPWKTMPPEEIAKPVNAQNLFRLAGELLYYADLLRRISPIDDLLLTEKETTHANDNGKPQEPGAAGTAKSSAY